MKKTCILVAAVIALSGCQAFSVANQKLKSVVDHYCSLPAFEREINRDVINKQIAPHKIELECNNAQ